MLTKRGHVALHAFPSGAWSITLKEAATDDNPHGILLSSFENGPVGQNLDDAMRLAEQAAKGIDRGGGGSRGDGGELGPRRA